MAYTYDANGNRLTQSGTQSATYTISSTSNRITSASISGTPIRTYSYDASGNTTADGTHTFTYRDNGRMSSATSGGVTTSYVLNALGQRVRKSNTSLTRLFVYDESGHLLGEYDGTGALVQETVWMGDIPVATLRPNGGSITLYYVHTDHLNTPRRVSRPSDNLVLWQWDSDPFGTAAANEDPDGDAALFAYALRFPGQYADGESGLNYNYFRDYDPATGRYIQSDPVGLRGGPNTYGYVRNDPLLYVDPRGLLSLTVSTQWSLIDSFGDNTLGLTERYLRNISCKCEGCGNEWKLTGCSASFLIDVHLLGRYSSPEQAARTRLSEQEHVQDYKDGVAEMIRRGEIAERSVQAKRFSSKAACEMEGVTQVTRAMAEALHETDLKTHERDSSGSHTYHGP